MSVCVTAYVMSSVKSVSDGPTVPLHIFFSKNQSQYRPLAKKSFTGLLSDAIKYYLMLLLKGKMFNLVSSMTNSLLKICSLVDVSLFPIKWKTGNLSSEFAATP
jgi:hypothetical protein